MILTDLHVHSDFCDGKDSVEDLILTAIDKKVEKLGILAHSYVDFDKDGTLFPDKQQEFIQTVNYYKDKYKDKIELFCGVELDVFSNIDTSGFDYIIGSVHYIKIKGKYYAVDLSEEIFVSMVKDCFGGDYYKAVEYYFLTISDMLANIKIDIIGHFDLISKYNKDNRYFNEEDPRYINAYKKAIDKLVKFNKPFEVNTGAIYRGYRTCPYPSESIISYIKKKGGRLILSSDAHSKEAIAFYFEELNKMLF